MTCLYCEAPGHLCTRCGMYYVPSEASCTTNPCANECSQCAVERVPAAIADLAARGLITIGAETTNVESADER